jgi:uncharacterized protein with PQ loop repeat
MVQQKAQFIAIISGILTIIAFSTLVLTVHVTKRTENLTYQWIILVLSAQTLLFIYGVINNAYGIYIPSSIIAVGTLYILIVKLHYNKKQDEKILITPN